jgi:mitochondrial-processing peptidase subunit beta
MGKAINILSDILLNSNLDMRAIEKERSVILREMEEVRVCWPGMVGVHARG